MSSSRAAVEYVIWRRWEDCLDFQRTLEVEYSAVSKRRRKGEPARNHHAKDMLYPSQRAASFESLPLGPDPSTIPVDVHAHIPRLSKKSSIFRPNESSIQQRGEEFKAMIEALFDEDAPSTLQELRTVTTVRDFFGYWRRDKDSERKSAKTLALGSATQSSSHQGKSGDLLKQSSVLTPELIAFAGGKVTGPSKPKQPSTRSPSQSTLNGSRGAQYNPAYEPGRPSASGFAQVVSPHTPFFVSESVTSGESLKRRPPSYRPAEGTMLFRSPASLNSQSNIPVLDSPRPSLQYTPTSSPYGDGFSYQHQQRSSPLMISTGSYPSLPAPYPPHGSNMFTNSIPIMHPMQARTASMPLQRRQRNGQMSSSPGPTPVPRRRNDTIDVSGNRSARIFDASTGVVSSPTSISPSLSEGERETNRGHRRRRSRSQVDPTLANIAIPHHTEKRQSYGSSDMSAPSPVQTLLLSSDQSTSITTPQSSQYSSKSVQRHQTVPSWSLRRMSFDSLTPADLGHSSEDHTGPYVTQDSNPRYSVSSDSPYTNGWSSDVAPACPPFASLPSLIPPSKLQSSSSLQPPSPAPPRPPRSALRASSLFSRATSSPVNSPLTPAEDGGASVPVDVEPLNRVSTNDDFVNSYLEMPSSAKSEDPFELEFRPQTPLTTPHRARGIANRDGTGRTTPLIVIPSLSQLDSVAPSPPSQASPKSPPTPFVGATTTIKAVHEASGTILLFRVPRMSTSLADLRKKLSRKFLEAENIKILPEQLELRCLAPASAAPNMANRPATPSDGGTKSTHGAHGLWLPLNTEADWHIVAANPSGKVTVKIF